MKKTLHVTFGAMLAISVVSTVQAAAYDDILGRTALLVTGNYTQLSNNGLEYGPLLSGTFPSNTHIKDSIINPSWSWDYGVGLTHRFCNSDTRVFFYWDHYRNDDSESAPNVIRDLVAPPVVTAATANAFYGSDEVRLGISQSFEFDKLASVSVGGFFEWVKLTRDLHIFDAVGAYHNLYNKMDGYGPGISAMARVYPFGSYPGIGAFLTTSTSLLYTNNHFSQVEMSYDGVSIASLDRVSTSDSIVGKVDISFGLDYCQSFMRDSVFGLSLGMRYLNVFNAFKNANQSVNFGDIPVATSTDDWGRIGPFLQLRIGGKDA